MKEKKVRKTNRNEKLKKGKRKGREKIMTEMQERKA